MEGALQAIADATDKRKNVGVNRLAGRMKAMLGYATIEEIMDSGLDTFLKNLRWQCIQIHNALQETYITYPIESALRV